MFKWAAGEELIPAGIAQALTMVAGLRRGRTEARETSPVLPVEENVVDATLPFLPNLSVGCIADDSKPPGRAKSKAAEGGPLGASGGNVKVVVLSPSTTGRANAIRS